MKEVTFLSENEYSEIILNICSTFSCDSGQIKIMNKLGGCTNSVFRFKYNEKMYVYRHPSDFSNSLIYRGRESLMQFFAHNNGLDTTLISINAIEGWRISEYIDSPILNTHNFSDVKTALTLLKKLHSSKSKVIWRFNVFDLVVSLREKFNYDECIKKLELSEYVGLIETLYNKANNDGIPHCNCHGDCRNVNFLIGKSIAPTLIDWEFSGYADPGFDIGSFIGGSVFNNETIDAIIEAYLGHGPSKKELRHFYAFIAITSFSYLLLTEYYIYCGQGKEELTILHSSRLRYVKEFSYKAFVLYE